VPSKNATLFLMVSDIQVRRLRVLRGEQGRRNGNHTVRVDDGGRVWSSGGRAISLLNPTTKEWQHFDLTGTYGNVIGYNGDE
jgi:hypothetical protein